MFKKMQMRLVAVLTGTALMVAPISLGSCELLYTPSGDLGLPVEDGSEILPPAYEDDGDLGDFGGYQGGQQGGWFYGGGFWMM